MKFLFVPVLAAVLTQPDDEAEKLFRAMEAKIAGADTLRVTFVGKLDGAIGGGASFKGQALVGTGNKLRQKFTLDFVDKTSKIEVVSDGVKIVSSQDGKVLAPEDTSPALRLFWS